MREITQTSRRTEVPSSVVCARSEAAEAYWLACSRTPMCAIHAKRVTIMPKDIRLAKREAVFAAVEKGSRLRARRRRHQNCWMRGVAVMQQ
ncbi:hypothetical protein Scep_015267 [Stephania cephalantha]|uniref:Core Histone H2A/H2B/H3 domain-containing protein n=1 Tax=Stephania cephalantha TaxID=152367 RepID=A0AAP0J5D6_9MAGN